MDAVKRKIVAARAVLITAQQVWLRRNSGVFITLDHPCANPQGEFRVHTVNKFKRSHSRLSHLASAALVAGLQLCALETVFAEDAPLVSSDVMLTPGIIDTGEYGFGWGSGIHPGGLVVWFVSQGQDLKFSVNGYDIDSNTEVKVLLNGQLLGYLSAGTDNSLNSGNTFLLPAQAQSTGLNEIRFVTNEWGVTDLLLKPINNPPTVSLQTPSQNAIFFSGGDVLLEASAMDSDGSIAVVEFFAGDQKLGEAATVPYSIIWANVAPGSYSITAKAKDNQMVSTASEAVLITICNDADGNTVCDVQPTNSIINAALASMAPNTWRKLNLNQFQDAWPPIGLRPNSTSPSRNISGWSGAAWDTSRDKFYIWGGDIGSEEGNEVYAFNATNGMWERGSLPSAIAPGYTVTNRPSVIGGVFDAPLSGESWDNVIYLENLDRLAILGISRNSTPWKDSDGTLTGPYFWDPKKADPNKVGGSDGTGVDPTTPGGNMWENRDNNVTARHLRGSTVHVDNDGVDEVLFNDSRANLWRYSVDPLDSLNDTWKQLAARPNSGLNADGGAAYDPIRKIYVRPGAKENTLLYWDLNRESEGVFKGETVLLDPSLGRTIDFGQFGLDYDPILDKLVFWGAEDSIIQIDFEDLINIDVTNVANIRGFFQINEIVPTGMDKPFDFSTSTFTGVFGKWHYMKDKNAFIGVIDPIAGDVYIYKSNDLGSPDSLQ